MCAPCSYAKRDIIMHKFAHISTEYQPQHNLGKIHSSFWDVQKHTTSESPAYLCATNNLPLMI